MNDIFVNNWLSNSSKKYTGVDKIPHLSEYLNAYN